MRRAFFLWSVSYSASSGRSVWRIFMELLSCLFQHGGLRQADGWMEKGGREIFSGRMKKN